MSDEAQGKASPLLDNTAVAALANDLAAMSPSGNKPPWSDGGEGFSKVVRSRRSCKSSRSPELEAAPPQMGGIFMSTRTWQAYW